MSLLASVRSKVAGARKALQTVSGSVGDVRAAIAKLQDERRAVETAPVIIEEAAEALDETIVRLLGGIHTWTTPADLIDAAARGQPADVRQLSDQHRMAVTILALQPVLREQFRQSLDQRYETLEPGLPQDARRQRLSEIDAQLGELEREEENLISELAGAGVAVARRADASPAALLGISE